jgi:hypothetical protein
MSPLYVASSNLLRVLCTAPTMSVIEAALEGRANIEHGLHILNLFYIPLEKSPLYIVKKNTYSIYLTASMLYLEMSPWKAALL